MAGNSHYIAQRATRPWEIVHNGQRRHLYHYTFETERFGVHSSEIVYSFKGDDAWSDEVETFLNTNVEQPLNSFLDCVDRDPRAVEFPGFSGQIVDVTMPRAERNAPARS